jgi:hypothetical protein
MTGCIFHSSTPGLYDIYLIWRLLHVRTDSCPPCPLPRLELELDLALIGGVASNRLLLLLLHGLYELDSFFFLSEHGLYL